ncbi:phenylalanine--tRNA ligase, mitochondrial [Galendromus occidentalis]|uniref:phenylalanine--tRNA ligase n=1 Tax=Galendromus occidentalis TaxID=34638 RepID=A0AAJ7L5T1_9ACAR|nr:phenylalanine--tRNA ligase, mitochondrial [Galendromus occidentalis]
MLRAHTSAHQRDLIASGLDAFLAIGDVYRRDEIDRTHYPVFHQVEGVRLLTKEQLFKKQADSLNLFETSSTASKVDIDNKQSCHSMETAKLLEHELKSALEGMVSDIFQEKLEFRWVDTYFPFTHPSFELEIKLNDVWIECLGCGIVRQEILRKAGVQEKVAWAFGIGLERIAMLYYGIEDIRSFWSEDPGFNAQFNFSDPFKRIQFKAISTHPACIADMSFWVPDQFEPNDFYDIVRSIGTDLVQEVAQIDVFKHPKTSRTSHCYRITYRHMDRALTQSEVNVIHNSIAQAAKGALDVELRTIANVKS